MPSRKRSKDEEVDVGEMFDVLEDIQDDLDRRKLKFDLIPPGWSSVARDTPVTPPKAKVSLSLDEDMVAWFRSLGRGYQPRMNAVLRVYMLSVIAKEIRRKAAPG